MKILNPALQAALGLSVAAYLLIPAATAVGQVNWSPATSPTATGLKAVAFGSGVFVAVGDDGTLLRSANHGSSWEDRGSVTTEGVGFMNVAYGNGKFLAASGDAAFISADLGLTWTPIAAPADWAPAYAYGNGRWIATGSELISASLNNGQSWSAVATNSGGLTRVMFNGMTAVAVGSSIYASQNGGVSWTDVAEGRHNWLASVAYGNGLYVTVGGVFGNTIVKSANPMSWPDENATFVSGDHGFQGVAYGNEKFVVVGLAGEILVSDGTETWTPASSGTSEALLAAAYGDGTFVAVGDAGTILTSGRAPQINSSLTASGTAGQPFSYTITALYGPVSFGAINLPADLNFNSASGVISGTPATAHTNQVTISATNPHGSDTRTLTIIINPAGSGGDFRLGIYTAVELEIPTKVGKQYQVMTSPNLSTWSNHEAAISGTGQTIYRLYSTRDPNCRFYKVEEK